MASVSTTQSSTRPLVLQHSATRLSIPIPSSSEAWIAAEVIREEFYHSIDGDNDLIEIVEQEFDDEGNALPAVATLEPQVKLLSKFLAFVDGKVTTSTSKTDVTQILLSSFQAFNNSFLQKEAVHTLVQGYDVDIRAQVLAAYYKAFSTLRKFTVPQRYPWSTPVPFSTLLLTVKLNCTPCSVDKVSMR